VTTFVPTDASLPPAGARALDGSEDERALRDEAARMGARALDACRRLGAGN
jgi:hypothetical protein